MVKLKKRKKNSRYHGRGMGSCGGGARKKRKKSGHRGGCGMSGSGKRADHKKTLVQKLYGHKYFGKQGITSKKTKRDTRQRINIGEIGNNLEKYGRKGKEGWEIDLRNYKILGEGQIKEKIILNCLEASKGAINKIEAAGGKVIFKIKKENEEPSEDKWESQNEESELEK